MSIKLSSILWQLCLTGCYTGTEPSLLRTVLWTFWVSPEKSKSVNHFTEWFHDAMLFVWGSIFPVLAWTAFWHSFSIMWSDAKTAASELNVCTHDVKTSTFYDMQNQTQDCATVCGLLGHPIGFVPKARRHWFWPSHNSWFCGNTCSDFDLRCSLSGQTSHFSFAFCASVRAWTWDGEKHFAGSQPVSKYIKYIQIPNTKVLQKIPGISTRHPRSGAIGWCSIDVEGQNLEIQVYILTVLVFYLRCPCS